MCTAKQKNVNLPSFIVVPLMGTETYDFLAEYSNTAVLKESDLEPVGNQLADSNIDIQLAEVSEEVVNGLVEILDQIDSMQENLHGENAERLIEVYDFTAELVEKTIDRVANASVPSLISGQEVGEIQARAFRFRRPRRFSLKNRAKSEFEQLIQHVNVIDGPAASSLRDAFNHALSGRSRSMANSFEDFKDKLEKTGKCLSCAEKIGQAILLFEQKRWGFAILKTLGALGCISLCIAQFQPEEES